MWDYNTSAFDRACQIIDFWYRRDERDIAVSPHVFADCLSGLLFLTRAFTGPVPASVPKRRLVYKDAIVYVADGWY